MCFFYCLGKCINPNLRSDKMRTSALVLFHEIHQLLKLDIPSVEDYEGFDIDEYLHLIEDKYKLSITIWTSEKKEFDKFPRAFLYRKGTFENRKEFKPINWLIYKSHLMWIKNFDAFFKEFYCSCCNKQFKTPYQLHKHEKKCTSQTKFTYKYGLANETRQNTLTRLCQKYEIPFDGDIKYPWFVTIDYESFLIDYVSNKEEKNDKTIFINEHIPSSVALASSPAIYNIIPEYKTYFNCVKEYLDENQDLNDVDITNHCIAMNKDTFNHIFNIQEIASKEARKKWEFIENVILEKMNELDELAQMNKLGSETALQDKIKRSIRNKWIQMAKDLTDFSRYCNQMPVLGFSSGRYDLGCSKLYGIFQALMEMNELKISNNKVHGMIRKGNIFMQIQTDKLILLDLQTYIGPGVTLDKLFEDYLGTKAKETFPYEMFKSVSFLDRHPNELTKENFKSNLKDYSPEEEEEVWKRWLEYIGRNNFNTMLDVLKDYNLKDVIPMIDVIQILQTNHYPLEFELLKDVSSLPQIANRARQYQSMDKYVWPLYKNFKFHEIEEQEDSEKITHNFDAMAYECTQKNMDMNRIFENEENVDITENHIINIYEKQYHQCSICRKNLEYNFCQPYYETMYAKPDSIHLLCNDCNKPAILKNNSIVELRNNYIKNEWLENNPMPMTIDDEEFHNDIDNHGIVGGLSTVFSRYHKVGETSIQNYKFDEDLNQFIKTTKWDDLSDESKIVRAIMAFDANALYAYCQQQPIPCGRKTRELTSNMSMYLPFLMKGELYDWEKDQPFFYKIDAHVPKHLINKFKDFPPFFQKQIITYDMLSSDQQKCWDNDKKHRNYKSTKIINKLSVKNQLYTYASVRWFVQNGIVIDKLHYVVHCEARKVYGDFVEHCCNGRREADIAKNLIKQNIMKAWLTNSYGFTLKDKRKYKEDRMSSDVNTIRKWINNNPRLQELEFFEDINGETVYLGNFTKKTIKCDASRDVGLTILDYSHLHMVRFVHDFLFKYLNKEQIQLMCMDTDSMFFAISSNDSIVLDKINKILTPIDCSVLDKTQITEEIEKKNSQKRTLIDSLIRIELKEEYERVRHLWLPSESNYKYDKYTPGLFKLDGFFTILAANQAKSYIGITPPMFVNSDKQEKGYKLASKGQQQKYSNLQKMRIDNFKEAIFDKKGTQIENRGFRLIEDKMLTYKLTKSGLTTLFDKALLFDDGVTTYPFLIQDKELTKKLIEEAWEAFMEKHHFTNSIKMGDELKNEWNSIRIEIEKRKNF